MKHAVNTVLKGELAKRIEKNRLRFYMDTYSDRSVALKDHYDWPADYRGRILLARVLHYRLSGKSRESVADFLEKTLAVLGETGVMDGIGCEEGFVNEQQLSGHSWMLRALSESARDFNDARIEKAARALFENLFYVNRDAFQHYPIERKADGEKGEPMGQLDEQVGRWKLSTDIGCVFIPLDGLSDYYALTKDERALEILNVLIDRFRAIDPVKSALQTHATLTGIRGVLRMARLTSSKELLDFAEERFRTYLDHGMTSHYANFNWFTRPSWTEPCAIVDSFMAAMQLFEAGRGDEYAEIAGRILYSGLLSAQRDNGGFGCDSCPNPTTEKYLFMNKRTYEAFWCCSMRGAEGVTAAASYTAYENEKEILFPLPAAGDFTFEKAQIDVNGDFAITGKAVFTVKNVSSAFKLRIFVPEGFENVCADAERNGAWLEKEVSEDCTFAVSADLPVRRIPNPAGYTLWKGQMLLAGESESSAKPIMNRFRLDRQMIEIKKQRVIF